MSARPSTLLALLFSLLATSATLAQINPSTSYQIKAVHSGKCLDISGGPDATGNGVPALQWECTGASNQAWRVVPVSDGYFKLIAVHSGKALDVQGGTIATANGVIVGQWDFNNADNQLWRMTQDADGSYRISAKHSGKSLDVNGGPGAVENGARVQQWEDVGAANQRWHLVAIAEASHQVMTRFNPMTNGFHFSNSFANDLSGGAKSDGLCGGMMYAALDYFLANEPAPSQDYRPAIGTTLQTYLFNRQTTQIVSNLERFEDMILASGPNGDKKGYYLRGISDAVLRELRTSIDAGTPVVLALQDADDSLGHSVLAIGYDMGRYLGDGGDFQDDVKLFVYDPNHPDTTRTLSPNPATQRYVYADNGEHDPHAHWVTFFVDSRYRRTPAPQINTPKLGGDDGLLRELRISFNTGGDELVGNNDDIDVTVTIDGRAPQVFRSVNNHMRWMSFDQQIVSLVLDTPAAPADVRSIEIRKSQTQASLGVDAWDLDRIVVNGYGGGLGQVRLVEQSGQPLVRLDGSRGSYVATVR